MPTVALFGTLDTKGAEYEYFRERVRAHGADVVLVDVGVLEPGAAADIPRQEVAAAAGADVEELARVGDRGAAVGAMARGAAEIAKRLHAEGRLDGIAGLGGSGGSSI
ncbi:MAG: Tm-1-like ATP-binding domain-containing protein, partial [Thermoleophilia bacterium]|nr:Tm-1-like ATP-binding domain-containing protein [Thermoleophilia bacterium]